MTRDQIPGLHASRVAAELAVRVNDGSLDLPLPGQGQTLARWTALAALAAEDLSLARLAEGHTDALAILAELGSDRSAAGGIWGVWAAQPPGPGLRAHRAGAAWVLDGTKQYCSGARVCTRALVTAAADDGTRLFAVDVARTTPIPGTWPATGMAASDTLNTAFAGVPAEPVGRPDAYVERPGFAHGGAGVAACWYGGARAVGQTVRDAAAGRDIGPHALAQLGAIDIALTSARLALERAAAEIDGDPVDHEGGARIRTLRLKALVEAAATDVMGRAGRALGAGPLCHDEAHGRRVADLTVYLRQHHAERNLAELGELIARSEQPW